MTRRIFPWKKLPPAVRGRGLRLARLTALLALNGVCASCASLQLTSYRDDQFLKQYRYTLGEEYLDVNGMRFCYQERGQGETVLLLPGLGMSIDFWQLTAPALAEQYHVVALDPVGFGKSDKPDASYDLEWICDNITAFLDAKQLRRVSIVGGSLGGQLAMLLALKHPQRVNKLVLMGSSGTWPTPGILLDLGIRAFWTDWFATEFLRSRWPAIYAKIFRRQTPVTQHLFRYHMALRAAADQYAPEGRAASRAMRSIFYHSCRDRLGEIQCPVLLIWGEFDEIHPREAALYLRDHLPNARLVVVPDAGHEAMLDEPAVFNQAVLDFLQNAGPPATQNAARQE